MEPTIYEVIFWSVIGIGGLLAIAIGAILNPHYDPKGDDPYRYCPREED